MDVTVMIPTMNRGDMLLRLIKYYDSLAFDGRILIGDSSSDDAFRRSVEAVRPYTNRLHIEHVHVPGHSVSGAIRMLTERIETGFVCLVPDDDFVVPRMMGQCIEFLNRNREYVAAHGSGLLIASLLNEKNIHAAGPYPQPKIEAETAEARIMEHFGGYAVGLFSVHRTQVWKSMFAELPDPATQPERCDKSFIDELLPNCLSVVYGKVKEIDGLYLVRHVHASRYLLPTWFDWLRSEKWAPTYGHVRRVLSNAISAQDGTEIVLAEAVVDRAFSLYLHNVICRPVPKLPGRLERIARASTIATLAWRSLRALRERFRPDQRISLKSLLNHTSPFADDFAPVFRAVTGDW